MTSRDLKYEIQKAIDNMPESVLENVLEYLQQVQKSKSNEIDLSSHLGIILREDKNLLQRLAL